jgi:putative sugar O-methyltransferase
VTAVRDAGPAERDGTPCAEDARPAAETAAGRAAAGPAPPGSPDPPWTTAAFRRHLEALADSRAYRNYQTVRDRVLTMKEHHQDRDTAGRPSAYWREELSGFEYILDASPLVVAKLRHHTHHVTGLRPYEYRSHRDPGAFRDKLDRLVAAGGKDLLVPEARQLGGFGFEIDGALFNLDTLKFYEALIALDHGGLLADFRAATERRVVWEIGAGWGGFAYQFKTLFPNVTYVISDLPELFLFSAVYLMEAFPDARVEFHSRTETHWETWKEADFVFVPATRTDDVRPGRVDLTINMVSFQEMREDQVRRYAGAAARLGCPYIYSLNRDRSPYNPELGTVREALAEHYWLHEIPVLGMSYTKLGPVGPRGRKPLLVSDLEYRHVIGWRRAPEGAP